jgi:hypothetical protein
MPPRGGGGPGGMPTEAWLFACGFRVVIGKLMNLTLPQGNHLWVQGDPDPAPNFGTCHVLICGGNDASFEVDFHTAIIGLQPAGTVDDPDANPAPGEPVPKILLYHLGELVQVNLRARSRVALSIERYFTNVSHQSNTQDG